MSSTMGPLAPSTVSGRTPSLIKPSRRPFGQVFLKRNIGCESEVRLALITLGGRRVGKAQLVQPLDLTSSNVARDQKTNRIAVVSRQLFSIHFVGKEDIS